MEVFPFGSLRRFGTILVIFLRIANKIDGNERWLKSLKATIQITVVQKSETKTF